MGRPRPACPPCAVQKLCGIRIKPPRACSWMCQQMNRATRSLVRAGGGDHRKVVRHRVLTDPLFLGRRSGAQEARCQRNRKDFRLSNPDSARKGAIWHALRHCVRGSVRIRRPAGARLCRHARLPAVSLARNGITDSVRAAAIQIGLQVKRWSVPKRANNPVNVKDATLVEAYRS